MEDNITIIEGPPPTFEAVNDEWVQGLSESPNYYNVAITRLRTFNGPALVERCYRAWKKQKTIFLEFKMPDGLEYRAPIVAARNVEVEEGHMLVLWVMLNSEDVILDDGSGDDFDEGDISGDDPFDLPDDDFDDLDFPDTGF